MSHRRRRRLTTACLGVVTAGLLSSGAALAAPAPKPVPESAPDPVAESVPESAREAVSDPVPVPVPAPQPVPDPVTAPVAESVPEPAPVPESVPQSVPESAAQSAAPEKVPESVPGPAPDLAPEPVPEAVPSAPPVLSSGAEIPSGTEKQKPPRAPSPALGAYLDYGPKGVQRIAAMEKWLGGTDLRVGHTYLPGDVWSNIEGSPGFLADWAAWRQARADRLFVLNVPMLERAEGRVPDRMVRRELHKGSAGQYDSHFRKLAERLVGLGVPDTVIVLGWEMNGTTYTHRCGPDPEAWKKYWHRIVTTMRDVPGQKFRFDFAPNRGRDAIPWTECYPGDDVVDIIGMDSYDQPPGRTFDEQVNEPYGLQEHVDFAAAHGKVISYPEWGLFRNGDNPEYVRRMIQWIDTYKPVYNTVTDYCPHGIWQCDKNPKSSQVFQSMLYGRQQEPETPATPEPEAPVTPKPEPTPEPKPTPTPVPTPVPEPARPQQHCAPLDLGPWVEKWLGGKLCVRLGRWEHWRG
ncbi:glycosyl hydrolase [Streptomyces sp. NPDC088554]|uniref:glycoside hydrolase family 26 protein n=1 Tax=Streptomyces sp. NPDC088554 TaxID=3365865 RepID=UPI0037FB7012